MTSVNMAATHKFVVVLNEKSPVGKLLSATGQIAMSLYSQATEEQKTNMSFIPFFDSSNINLITLSTCSFVVLKGNGTQLLSLYTKATEQNLLSAIFTSTMSFNGVEENLFEKTAHASLSQIEPYGVGLFGQIQELNPLTKKFSVFK